MTYLLAALLLVTGAAALAAAKLTRHDRNYWPMLRIIWAMLAFAYTGGGVARLLAARRGAAPAEASPPLLSLVFTGAILFALLYAIRFMARRNRTPRFLALSVGGEVVVLPVEELRQRAETTISWARHGAMDAATAAELRAALDRWAEFEDWRRRTLGEARTRHAAKGGSDA